MTTGSTANALATQPRSTTENPEVVVLGSGYAGAGAIPRLEEELGQNAELTWVSDTDYHFVLHESHRIIRDESVKHEISIPVDDIKSSSTDFIRGEVTDINTDAREVVLNGDQRIDYDYVLVALGSETAFYGIDGLAENAFTLKSRDDAVEIHDAVKEAAQAASRDDPARVVIGGAGLSGIQSAGEVAEFRDRHDAPIEVTLVEALEEIFPPGDPEIQGMLRYHLQQADVNVLTNDPIIEATPEEIRFGERDSLEYDVFLWAGGVTGRDALSDVEIEDQHNRLEAGQDFQTEEERVFAIGDSAVVDQPGEHPAPPTAQAAWQAADVVAQNIANAIRNRPLKQWTYDDHGTLISIGETAIAHEIDIGGVDVPLRTFDSTPAKILKKGAAARWIAKITDWRRAFRTWDVL